MEKKQMLAPSLLEADYRYLDSQLKAMERAGADILTVHYEACTDVERTIDFIKGSGIKAGIAIKPGTSTNVLTDNLLQKVDVVHLMTVEPGLEGQTFIPKSLSRIAEIKNRLYLIHPDCNIEVDGNITPHNIDSVLQAGANITVMGKAIFSGNMVDNIRAIKKIIRRR